MAAMAWIMGRRFRRMAGDAPSGTFVVTSDPAITPQPEATLPRNVGHRSGGRAVDGDASLCGAPRTDHGNGRTEYALCD